jgi:replicative DNA helicase
MIKLKDLAERLVKELHKEDSKEEVSQKDLELFLEQYKGSDKIVRSDELIEQVKKNGIRKGMPTGVDELDKLTGGFYEEQVIVVTAYPKAGKTSWVLFEIDKMEKYSPLFLAIEQSPTELIEQMLERNIKIPFFYAPASTETDRTTDWIHLKILETQYRSTRDNLPQTKIVFIDHFGYVIRKKSSDQVTWEIINTMQELKAIARQTKTAIVLIVHTTKPDETEPPTAKDLFGSAGYHQEADLVLSLWRETYKNEQKILVKTRNVLLQVLANRKKGETGAIKFEFNNGVYNTKDWNLTSTSKGDKELDDFVKDAQQKF